MGLRFANANAANTGDEAVVDSRSLPLSLSRFLIAVISIFIKSEAGRSQWRCVVNGRKWRPFIMLVTTHLLASAKRPPERLKTFSSYGVAAICNDSHVTVVSQSFPSSET